MIKPLACFMTLQLLVFQNRISGLKLAPSAHINWVDTVAELRPSKTKDKCAAMSTDVPIRCPQGNNRWTLDELRAAIPEFAKLYKTRPISVNVNGMNANHVFALWFAVAHLKPQYIIESGVNKGQTTWLLRQAAPQATIYSLDPRPVEFLEFKDENKKTHYLMGKEFKDLSEVDWNKLIPAEYRSRTFVMLDDHMSSIKRSAQLLAHDFVHLWYDDNWNGRYGGTDCYSFNQVCTPAFAKEVLMKDSFNKNNTMISAEQHDQNSKWLSDHMDIYFEFPALFDGCADHVLHEHQQSLLKREELLAMGLPSIMEDRNHYLHLYPPYVKLKKN